MLHVIQYSTTIRHYLPASSSAGGVRTLVAMKRPDMGKPEKTEVQAELTEVPAELTERLNKLAKARPFSNLHRVKKYDPL